MQRPTMREEIAGHNVAKLGRQEGETIQIADLRLTWKAEGERTGYQFSAYEMTLAPDVGIPLHKHPYPEFFYVIEGQVDFARIGDEGTVEWMACKAGDCVTAPPNAPHTFHNHGGHPARFLSVSSYNHELMLKAGGTAVGIRDPLPKGIAPEVFEKFAKASEKNQVYVVEA